MPRPRTGRPPGRPPAWRIELLRALLADREWSAIERIDLDRYVDLRAELRRLDFMLARDPVNATASAARARAATAAHRLATQLGLTGDYNTRRQAETARQRERAAGLQADGSAPDDTPLGLLNGAYECPERGGYWTTDGLLALGDDLDQARALLAQTVPEARHRGRRSTRDQQDGEA